MEVVLDGFTMGFTSVEAAIADHGLNPNLGGRPVEIVLWTDDTDGEYARVIAGGAPSLSKPHDCCPISASLGWRTPTAVRSSSFSAASGSDG